MTFSRRAAAEMTRRAGRICAQALGSNADAMTEALTWAGTFHAIGARLLRDYVARIGINPALTTRDRGDSAGLMNLVRHGLGLSKAESLFPTKAMCLAIYSPAANAEMPIGDVLRCGFPWCAEGSGNCGDSSRAASRPSRARICHVARNPGLPQSW